MHMLMIAANMIEFTLTHIPEEYSDITWHAFKQEDTYWKGPMRHLRASGVNWATHGYLNAAIMEFSFLYDCIKALLHAPDGYLKFSVLNQTTIPFFQRALTSFNTWMIREKKQAKINAKSEVWGDAFKFDWADLNEKMGEVLEGLNARSLQRKEEHEHANSR